MLLGPQGGQVVGQVPGVSLQPAALPGASLLHAKLVLGGLQLLLQLHHLVGGGETPLLNQSGAGWCVAVMVNPKSIGSLTH